MKEYQVELKVKGEGGVYPYIVSAAKEEWAEQDAIQMLLKNFPIFNGKEITTYKIICLEPKTRQTVFRQTEEEFERRCEESATEGICVFRDDNNREFILDIIEEYVMLLNMVYTPH